jgi:hypothetical protein
MKESTYHPDLISYDEMFHILHHKFNSTHDEVKYWVKKSLEHIKTLHKDQINNEGSLFMEDNLDDSTSLLFPYSSDLPYLGTYEYPPDNFFYSHCYFYNRKNVNKFIPSPPLRFVYQKDLTGKRNWNDYRSIDSLSLISQTLLKANEYGILRFYDPSLDEFTLYSNPSKIWCPSFEGEAYVSNQIWCHSFEGEAYVSNPDSFFLLYEILTLERVFFNKNRQACLDELDIKHSPLPANVYNFSKK